MRGDPSPQSSEQPRPISADFLTGSTEVGRVLLKEAADQVVNCSMELGGNAPFLVFADADLDAAVDGAMVAKMRNAGEACTAANRFYVQAPVAEEFSRRLAERMAALVVGPGTREGTEVGPLVNPEAVDKVDELVRNALDGGAKALTGGIRATGPGCYYPPTVLVGVRPDAELLQEEVFGPVAPIVSFDEEDEAIRLANSTEMGLVSYVFTGDLAPGCGSPSGWSPAWSASTAAWSATRRRPSAGSSRAAWAGRAAMRACSTTWRPSTSRSTGSRPPVGRRSTGS